jgi:hypothetical protein
MKIYELPCLDQRKSFYGKAHIIEHDDWTKELQSYETIVCKLMPDGDFYKTWDGYSATTMRHINSFLRFFGFCQYGGKAFWDQLTMGESIYL